MDSFVLARVLHVLGVVLWIGGVAMVTTVLLPSVRAMAAPEGRLTLFEGIEGRFARQARWTTLITGLSGFYMLHVLHAWDRYTRPEYWWISAMTLVWLIFTLMLFVLEPLVLHRHLRRLAARNPEAAFTTIQRLHWFLLMLSLLTIAGAVSGAHGWLLFT